MKATKCMNRDTQLTCDVPNFLILINFYYCIELFLSFDRILFFFSYLMRDYISNLIGIFVLLTAHFFISKKKKKKNQQTPKNRGFPDGSEVKNPPANTGDTVRILLNLGRFHMLRVTRGPCAINH